MFYFKDNVTGKEAKYETSLEIDNNEEYIIFSFLAKHCSFNSYSNEFNDELYKGDVLEIFIDRGEPNHYLEIEVAPNGALFIANIDYNDGVNRHINFLENKGICSKNFKEKDTLSCVLTISKKIFKLGNNLRFNAYRIETDGKTSEKYLFALNPTLVPNFHVPNKFVKFIKL